MVIRLHTLGSGLAALLNEVHSLAVSLATPHPCNPSGVLFVFVVLPHHPSTERKHAIHDNEHGNVLNG